MQKTSATTIRVPTEDYRRWQHLAVDTKTSVNQWCWRQCVSTWPCSKTGSATGLTCELPGGFV